MRITILEAPMSRLTITLDDDLHQALKETAARQGRSIGKIIEESLVLRGIKSMSHARQLVEQARIRGECSDDEATRLAVEETRDLRTR
jgi:predicted transcriptional regulator